MKTRSSSSDSPLDSRLSRREAARTLAAATIGAAFLPRVAQGAVAEAAAGTAAPAVAAGAAPAVGAPIRIGSNENPFGLGPKAMAAFEGYRPEVNRYPYDINAKLLRRLAETHDVSPDQILVTPGSGEVLRASAVAFTGPTKSLVAASPTFETPGRAAQGTGATVHAVPVEAAGTLDLSGMAAHAAGAGLFFVCNPNNPTGGVSGAAAIAEFVARVRRANQDGVILMDEAYHEYVEDAGYATSIPLVAKDPRLIVSRTFSKVYGMAGLRVGYVIGHTDTIAQIRRVTGSGMVNGLAAATALAALDDTEHIAKQRTLNHEARAYTRQAFESAGCKVLPSEGNFLMVDVKRDAGSFGAQCRDAGVVIARAFPPLTTFARISIGTPEEMRRAVAAMLPRLTAPVSARAEAAYASAAPVWQNGIC